MNYVYQQDCIEFLSTQSSNSVDLVVTDPPYFIGFDGGKGWDSQWQSEAIYLNWCKEWTEHCVRVLKPNRMLVVWGTLKSDTFLKYKLCVLSAISGIYSQNEIIWSYNWGGRSKSNFARKHEYAWCYSKGKYFLFNSEDILIERKLKKSLRTGKEYTKGTIPTCIWEYNNHTTSKDYIGWHPTTKNINVIERIVRAYTNTGDLVLDCFMGSGTTAVAAMRAKRCYVGCEQNPEYYKKLTDRLKNVH